MLKVIEKGYFVWFQNMKPKIYDHFGLICKCSQSCTCRKSKDSIVVKIDMLPWIATWEFGRTSNSHFAFFNDLRRHGLCSVCIGLVRFCLTSLVRHKTTVAGSLLVAWELTVWSVVSCFNISGHFFTKISFRDTEREQKTRQRHSLCLMNLLISQWSRKRYVDLLNFCRVFFC